MEEEKEVASTVQSDGKIKEMLLEEFDIQKKRSAHHSLVKNINIVPKDYVGLYNYMQEESITAIIIHVVIDSHVLMGITLRGLKASGTVIECNHIPDEIVDSIMSAYLNKVPSAVSDEIKIIINERRELVIYPSIGAAQMLIDPMEFDVE